MKKIVVVLVSFMMVACASSPKIISSQSPQAGNAHAADTQTLSEAEIEARRLAAERAAIEALKRQSVYFDLDQFSVKAEYQSAIQNQADFIKLHGNDVVTLEGNADERGSNEYNLALGDKRATSVRKNLEMLGISEKTIRTVSFGEEKPRQLCHEELCWKENRRVDFAHKLN